MDLETGQVFSWNAVFVMDSIYLAGRHNCVRTGAQCVFPLWGRVFVFLHYSLLFVWITCIVACLQVCVIVPELYDKWSFWMIVWNVKGYTFNYTNLTNPTMYQTNISQYTISLQKCGHRCTFLLQISALWGMGVLHCGVLVANICCSFPLTNVNTHFTAPGCRYYLTINSWWPIVTSLTHGPAARYCDVTMAHCSNGFLWTHDVEVGAS